MSHSFTDATPIEQSIFLLFMILWIVYGILNQYASINEITFDATQLVWSQEVLKIILSLILYRIQDGNMIHLKNELKEHWSMILWYLIPAGLYALGDVLTYVNLRVFDPATLHLLGEMKLVVTAIVHQQLFKKMLNKSHWLALIIITAGCVLKALDSMELSNVSSISLEEDINTQANSTTDSDEDIDTTTPIHHHPTPTIFNYSLIGIHILITTVAGVFNEKLLKDRQSICINLQNLCLYFDGILFLSLGMLIEGISDDVESTISETFISYTSLVTLFSQPSVASMAVIMSIGGIITSRFLKIFDSIRKSVATALVVVSLPLLSRLIFHTSITVKMIISILMVVLGMNIYTSQPPPARIDGEQTIKTKNSNAEGDTENDESELFLPSIALPGRQHTIHDHDRNGNGVQEMSKIRPNNLTIV